MFTAIVVKSPAGALNLIIFFFFLFKLIPSYGFSKSVNSTVFYPVLPFPFPLSPTSTYLPNLSNYGFKCLELPLSSYLHLCYFLHDSIPNSIAHVQSSLLQSAFVATKLMYSGAQLHPRWSLAPWYSVTMAGEDEFRAPRAVASDPMPSPVPHSPPSCALPSSHAVSEYSLLAAYKVRGSW